MIRDYLIAPSLTALFISGLLISGMIIFMIIHYKIIIHLRKDELLIIIALLTSVISSHGLLHLGVEQQYNFNPYTWI
jgi:hypothetical protein